MTDAEYQEILAFLEAKVGGQDGSFVLLFVNDNEGEIRYLSNIRPDVRVELLRQHADFLEANPATDLKMVRQ